MKQTVFRFPDYPININLIFDEVEMQNIDDPARLQHHTQGARQGGSDAWEGVYVLFTKSQFMNPSSGFTTFPSLSGEKNHFNSC